MEHAFSPENFQRENRTTFSKFHLSPENFSVERPESVCSRNFRNSLGNGKRPRKQAHEILGSIGFSTVYVRLNFHYAKTHRGKRKRRREGLKKEENKLKINQR